MSRPSFRPRPIDLTKPLPIIKTSKDLRNEDDVVVNRALPAVATGVDPSEEGERHLRQALLASVYGDDEKRPANIPVPVVRQVEAPAIPGKFERPTEYIMFDKSDGDLEDSVIDYDGDHVDEAFVKGKGIDMDVLERVLDGLEKLQARSEGDDLITYAMGREVLTEVAKVADGMRKEMYEYWVKRRKEKKVPLLRRFQAAPDPGNNDPAVAFRPRERDGGLVRRMNTYENFKRMTLLRRELGMLRGILDKMVSREEVKTEIAGMELLKQRVRVVADGGARIESVNRSVFGGENEPVVVFGQGVQTVIPVRGLNAGEIETELRRLGGVGDKISKKVRRKTGVKVVERKREVVGEQRGGVDTFGFDEHGNRFLKHMRYFAGGFMNYGVSPYDHRVFSAASERNTVRVQPREPPSVAYPSEVKFARQYGTNRAHGGGKVGRDGKVTKSEVRADIIGSRRFDHSETSRKRKLRARPRMGRGGRIMLDRVTFEREQGVKAASYPASVEMGGVYTGGLPLNAATPVSKLVKKGDMGEISKLATDDHDLVSPLEPLVHAGKPWPRRKRPRIIQQTVDDAIDWRSLPSYAPRTTPLIEEAAH